MADSSSLRAALQRRIDQLSRPRQPINSKMASIGHDEIDRILGGGLVRGKVHEIVADKDGHAASAAGFTAICARLLGGPIAWLRIGGGKHLLYPHGLQGIGIDPDQLLLISAPDASALLRAANDAIRCTALAAVVIELWGRSDRIDLTVSRRLVLSAEASGVTALLLRIAAVPLPSAAHTRWAVSSAPSSMLAANAPGGPAMDLDLLRQRGGPSGMRWRVEWNRDAAIFETPLSGAVAAVPAFRSMANEADERHRRTG